MSRKLRSSPVTFPGLRDVIGIAGNMMRGAVSAGSEWKEKKKEQHEEDNSEENQFVRMMVSAEQERRSKNIVSGMPATYHEGYADPEAVNKMRYSTLLGTDMHVSQLSMGLGAATGSYGKVERHEGVDAIRAAYLGGVNYFDTAPLFGYNRSGETILAEALEGVPRESYYVSTKVGKYLEEVDDNILGGSRWVMKKDYSAAATRESVEKSLEALKVDYIDLLYVHDPHHCDTFTQVRENTINVVAKLQEEGLVKYVGYSGYDVEVLNMLVLEEKKRASAGTGIAKKTQALQVVSRYNVLDHSLTKTKALTFRFFEYAFNSKLGIVNAAPLAMGLLTPRGPPSWHGATDEIKTAARDVVEYCQAAGVDPVRMALRFAFNQHAIATHLVGMATPQEVQTALDVATSSITKGEANCLNWATARFDDLSTYRWRESGAVWDSQGWLTEEAKFSRKISDIDASNSTTLPAQGKLRNKWQYLHYGGGM